MFTKLGLHLAQVNYEAGPVHGKFYFQGSVPIQLMEMKPATSADVMAGRAYRNKTDELVAPKNRYFDTVQLAMDAAKLAGAEVCSIPTCACAKLRAPIGAQLTQTEGETEIEEARR